MRSFDWKALIGSAALLATFVLAVPGVKAVRAEGTATSVASEDGPTCSQAGPEARLQQSAMTIEQLRQQIAAQLPPDAANQIVVLNNRGYNYGPGNTLDPAALALERQRAEH